MKRRRSRLGGRGGRTVCARPLVAPSSSPSRSRSSSSPSPPHPKPPRPCRLRSRRRWTRRRREHGRRVWWGDGGGPGLSSSDRVRQITRRFVHLISPTHPTESSVLTSNERISTSTLYHPSIYWGIDLQPLEANLIKYRCNISAFFFIGGGGGGACTVTLISPHRHPHHMKTLNYTKRARGRTTTAAATPTDEGAREGGRARGKRAWRRWRPLFPHAKQKRPGAAAGSRALSSKKIIARPRQFQITIRSVIIYGLFIYFYRYRRRRGGVKVGGGIVVVVGKMMRSVNREISCLVTPSPILLSSSLSGAVRGGGAGGEVCCCVPT
ncbi:Uncharacterized protein FWK35_00022985 [Aphis craccivora]|uniref:Uncharacterized protein n=1 Tax=Aphis craccivora TaxID=307492 RepID=A0A6G0ZJB8_APHCR|nr:Uncharacterized protein FWK35_00022985 [Aphis craccivora]